MSVATLRSVQTRSRRMPVLTPLYNAHHESFCAHVDGTYRCGTGTESEFRLECPGAESTHCTFERHGKFFSVNRVNGRVWVNDLPAHGRYQLADGDVISLGSVSFLLSLEDSQIQQPLRQSPPPVPASAICSPGSTPSRSSLPPQLGETKRSSASPSGDFHAPTERELATESELYQELNAQQELLSLRQQQLDELLETVRGRERNAESRLATIEERSLQVAAQWNEVIQKQKQLVEHEGELVQCSQVAQQQLRELSEQQRQNDLAGEECTRSSASIEQDRLALTIREQVLAEREHVLAEAEREAAARDAAAAAAAETRSVEQMAATAAEQEAAVRERQQAVEAQAELQQLQQTVLAQHAELGQWQEEIDSRANEVSARLQSLKAIHRTHRASVVSSSDTNLQELADSLDQQAAALSAERDELNRLLVEHEHAVAEAEQKSAARAGAIAEVETLSVEQMAVIAAGQEAAVRERQQAAEAQAELQQLQQTVLAQQEELGRWQEEIESRANEVSARLQSLKAIHRTHRFEQMAVIAAEQEAAVRERQTAAEAQAELQQLRQTVLAQQAELGRWQEEIDSRANEVSARLQSLKAIHRTHRASVVSSSDTNLQELADSLDQQAAALSEERDEIDRRLTELAAAEVRTTETQQAANAIVQATESERKALHSANKDLLCERNALSQLRQDLASREAGISGREVLVANQIEDMRSRFTALDQRAAELKHYESEIDSRAADIHRRVQLFKAEKQTFAETMEQTADARVAPAENDEDLIAVLQQLEDLRQQVTVHETERISQDSERENLLAAVRELQKALQDARQDVEEANKVKTQAALQQQRLEQASQTIKEHTDSLQLGESKLIQISEKLDSAEELVRQRDEEICELREKLTENDSTPATTLDDASVDLLSRELDERAGVLDRRDEELRERSRIIEQSESDLESQRRQILQARQQLEQARAEIQVAIRQQSESNRDEAAGQIDGPVAGAESDPSNADTNRSAAAECDGEHESAEAGEETIHQHTDLRSELAGLFGVHKASDSLSPPPLPQTDSEFVDLCEPKGENSGRVFHFDANAVQIVEKESDVATDAESAPAKKEESDDFMRDYMEQLLSRSRASAGNALPGELKAVEQKPRTVSPLAKTPEVKPARKVTSFIEQYMAGNMGNLDGGEPLSIAKPAAEDNKPTVGDSEENMPAQHRQKIDLQQWKQSMSSFRALSTQSVEQALASHAMKVKYDNASIRVSFAVVLITATLVIGVANAYDVIDAPMLTWVTLTASIGIVSELIRRCSLMRAHSLGACQVQKLTSESSAMASQKTDTNASESSDPDEVTIVEDDDYPVATAGEVKTLDAENSVTVDSFAGQASEARTLNPGEFQSSSRLT